MDATAMKLEDKKTRIVEAISTYKEQHPKWSPSDDFLARETQLPVTEVKYLVRQLETDGVIGIVGSWPRTMWVINDGKTANGALRKLRNKEKEVLTTVAPTQERHKKWGYAKSPKRTPRMALKKRAKQIAEALSELMEKGERIYVSDVSMLVFGHDQTGHMSVLLNKMKDKGWVHHGKKRHGDVLLTDKGYKDLLGIDRAKPEEVAEEVAPPTEQLVELMQSKDGPWDDHFDQAPQGTDETVPSEPDPEFAEPAPTYGDPATAQAVADMIRSVANAAADAAAAKYATVDLTKVAENDLVFELISRGYTISKR